MLSFVSAHLAVRQCLGTDDWNSAQLGHLCSDCLEAYLAGAEASGESGKEGTLLSLFSRHSLKSCTSCGELNPGSVQRESSECVNRVRLIRDEQYKTPKWPYRAWEHVGTSIPRHAGTCIVRCLLGLAAAKCPCFTSCSCSLHWVSYCLFFSPHRKWKNFTHFLCCYCALWKCRLCLRKQKWQPRETHAIRGRPQ